MKRRLFSLLLALVMCLSLLPTAAFAEDVTTTDGDTTGGTIITDTTGVPADNGEGADSTEGAAVPAPLLAAAAPMVGSTYAGSAHTHKDCGKETCTNIGHTCGSGSVSWISISTARELKDTGTIVGNKRFYLTTDITITETLDITVDNVVLCLNGHTITLNKDGPVIEVQSGKPFTLTDCTDAGMLTHAEDKTGCGVKVNGTFKMYGGNITGNRGNQSGAGGGVYVALGGTFNMHGGKITNNRGTYSLVGTTSRTYGGGVFVATNETTGSTFNMYGGTIGGTGEDDGNSAHYGGGVYVGDSGHFTMTGGSITGNSANYGSGVYVYADSISVGGNANITGNENKASMSAEKEDNVYLALNTKVSVNSGFNGSVGINVDVDEWKTIPTDETESNGKKWVVVAGDGLGAAVTGNKITYDNGEFSINAGTGKLSCLHVCDITYNSPYYKCKICNENVNLKTEFKNRAGNIIKTQYYATARAAFEAAQNNCVITMLTAAEFESYT